MPLVHRPLTALVAALAAFVAVLVAVLVAAPAPAGSTTGASDRDRAAQQVHRRTDAVREDRGLHDLRRSACATRAAQRWADVLAGSGDFLHQDLGDVLDLCPSLLAAENLYRSPRLDGREAVRAWMRSTGHRANLLRRDARALGVGLAQGRDGSWTYVQVFLGRRLL